MKPKPRGDAKYMGIDGDGRLPEDLTEDHVSGFAADARQSFEVLAGTGDLVVVGLVNNFCEFEDVFGYRSLRARSTSLSVHREDRFLSMGGNW